MAILLWFFALHWCLSVFCQTFYLHRYGAHRMFTMSKPVERFFHLLTAVTQGSSFLLPGGYAILPSRVVSKQALMARIRGLARALMTR